MYVGEEMTSVGAHLSLYIYPRVRAVGFRMQVYIYYQLLGMLTSHAI